MVSEMKTSTRVRWHHQQQDLAGRAAVITGGTTGIGRAIAVLLGSRGARTLIFGRHEQELRDAMNDIKSAGGDVHGLTADLSKPADIYVAAKSGIRGFSESLRKQVNEYGIKVTLIEPGKVRTDLVNSGPGEQAEKQEQLEMLTAEDIAECACYCLAQPKRCDIVTVQIRPHKQMI